MTSQTFHVMIGKLRIKERERKIVSLKHLKPSFQVMYVALQHIVVRPNLETSIFGFLPDQMLLPIQSFISQSVFNFRLYFFLCIVV